jgi:ribosomal protein S18 acetylase RimI-like enzyme
MEREDAVALNTLHALCHPSWPERSPLWWWTHPTLVLELDGAIIGSTSFVVCMPPTPHLAEVGTEIGYGHGVAVHSDHRGQNYGWLLADARHQVFRDLGIAFFIGMTQPDNKAMIHIFERQGLRRGKRIRKAYPDGADVVLYTGGVR